MDRHEISPLDTSNFSFLHYKQLEYANERYRKVAELLEKLFVLEPMLLTGRRLVEAAGIEPDVDDEKRTAIVELKKQFHDLLLVNNTYDQGPRLTLTASDVEYNLNKGWMLNRFEFRDEDARNLAYQIDLIASFQHELEGHVVNRYNMGESERNMMIQDTALHLREHINHLMNILTGVYER